MSDLGNIFNSFYSKLILRDLCGKVVPGSILLLALISSFIKQGHLDLTSLPLAVWILGFGFAWITGFAVQALGEKTGLIRYYPRILNHKAWTIVAREQLSASELSKKGGSEDEGQKNWMEFYYKFSSIADDGAIQQRERLVVIKEACGNTFVALLLTEVKLGLDVVLNGWFSWELWRPHLAAVAIVVCMTVLLSVMHRLHVNRQFVYMMEIVKDTD